MSGPYVSTRTVGRDLLITLFERMVLVRETEARLADLFNDGKIPGFIHLSIGQEATSVGVCAALREDDTLASTHRGHGHGLAKGVDPEGLVREILGQAEGLCGGQGGSLHVADCSVGMLGANGIVGAGIPIALGSAMAHAIKKSDRVAVSFFGDGAMAEGVFYESLNIAALWKLPILFVCENNGWSEFSPTSVEYRGNLQDLSGTFGIPYVSVDGNDASAVYLAASGLVAALRSGKGPAVLECLTLRVRGHYEGDPQKYRDGIEDRAVVDPILHVEQLLANEGLGQGEITAVREKAVAEVDLAVRNALQGTSPRYADALKSVYAEDVR